MRKTSIVLLGLIAIVPLGAITRGEQKTPPTGKLDFARDVRSILANHCWSCHGPDEASRAAGLRLDRRDMAMAPLKNGKHAIVPGNPAESALIARIDHERPSRRMPPPDFKKPMSNAQRRILNRWIAEGAEYAEHWAFVAPRRPALPEVKNKAWPINPIDDFVLHRLEKEGWHPSPPASKETLLRRVTLDLTGLPPTIDELRAVLADPAPDAYEKAVDRLLASPRYAEKMAIGWLDAARFADTNGYNNDEERAMWPWRDWVIGAFHKNMPFDQFLVEQLAGDMLPNPTMEQKLATGFNRNNVFTTEGGIIEEEYRVEYVADRVHTTATAFLGLSLQCARCHDHKYDPISQKEYYQFFAFFNNIQDKAPSHSVRFNAASHPVLPFAVPEVWAELAVLEQKLGQHTDQIKERETAAIERTALWEARLSADDRKILSRTGRAFHLSLDEGDGETVADERRGVSGVISGTPRWTDGKFGKCLEFDGSTHVDLGPNGTLESNAPFSISLWVNLKKGEGTLLSKIEEKSKYRSSPRGYDLIVENGKLACRLVGRWPEDAIKVVSKTPLALDVWHHIVVTYDGSRKAAGVKCFIDGKTAALDVASDSLVGSLQSLAPLRLGKRGDSPSFKGKLDEVQLFHQELNAAEIAELASNKFLTPRDILALEPVNRTEPQRVQLRRYYLENIDAEYRRHQNKMSELRKQKTELEKQIVPTMVMQEMPQRRETFVLHRGQHDQHGTKVEPGVPSVFPPLPKNLPPSRLAMAEWLVQPSHPLTARVAVNRWWAGSFGVGLVETVEDFGLQGELPSHPELLDWLATELVRTKWDIKAMQRLIVTSATFRQSATITPEHLTKDPKNRLLARSPRSHLPAETVRDNALAISGLLVEKVGGPSVKPYQPPGLWEDVTVERRNKYVPDTGDGYYRRGMYTFWRRTCPPPGMTTFDAPDRETCVARRSRTNTPMQALILLNDPTYLEASRVFAQRILSAAATDEQRLNYAFRLAVTRDASPGERQILMELLDDAFKKFRNDRPAAERYLAVGQSKRDPSLDAVELAAWTTVASTILNLDETISRP